MPDPSNIAQEILKVTENLPKFHRNPEGELTSYGISAKTLEFLCSLLEPGMKTLETGAGYSTVGFAISGTEHTSISLKEEEGVLIRHYCRENRLRDDFRHLWGSSDELIQSPDIPKTLDFILIDGAHRFPYAILDWHFSHLKLRIGGVLAVDDFKMPSVRFLVDFLLKESEWELIEPCENTIFFRKITQPSVSGDWLSQKINTDDYSWKTTSYELAKSLEEAAKKELSNPFLNYWKPGHYYSPIPSLKEIEANQKAIWKNTEFPDLNLNPERQVEALKTVLSHLDEIPFSNHPSDDNRYHFVNDYFPTTDGTVYFGILMEFKPKKVIEVGSGYSSALLLDANDQFFDNSIKATFIEPNPERLNSLLKKNDASSVTIHQSCIQQVHIDFGNELEENDILFVDSSHVSKIYSDVNILIFDILPQLKSGTLIHFHDIYYPFEYPIDWLRRGWAWNEAYILRAFLQNNRNYEILLWNRYATTKHHDELTKRQKSIIREKTGGSIWLRKL